MRGYEPKIECKRNLETSSKTEQFILELGMVQEHYSACDCEDGECKNK